MSDPRDLVRDDVDELTAVTTRWSDNDMFGHLNNAVYLHVVEDLLSSLEDLRSVPHRVVIEYLRPITRDAAVTIRHRRDEATMIDPPTESITLPLSIASGDEEDWRLKV